MNTATQPVAPAAAAAGLSAMKSFAEFNPLCLTGQSNRNCRRLHFVGSSPGLVCLVLAFTTGHPWWVRVGMLCGYAFTWVGHFGFEKNKPASFKRPLYSFMGDWAMYRASWAGKVKL